jgi:transcriptional regulator with XRE-family HTH domain
MSIGNINFSNYLHFAQNRSDFMNDFYKRYCDLCAKAGMSASGVASAIGLSNAAANGWKKGKLPNDTTLAKLSEYFGVTVEYLKGEETKNAPAPNKGTEVFMKMYDMLTPERQARLYEALSDLVKEQMQER